MVIQYCHYFSFYDFGEITLVFFIFIGFFTSVHRSFMRKSALLRRKYEFGQGHIRLQTSRRPVQNQQVGYALRVISVQNQPFAFGV